MKVTVELEIDISLADLSINDVKKLVNEMVSAHKSEGISEVKIKNVSLGT